MSASCLFYLKSHQWCPHVIAACPSHSRFWLLGDLWGYPVLWLTFGRSRWASASRSSFLLTPHSQTECRKLLGHSSCSSTCFLWMKVRRSREVMLSEGKLGEFLICTVSSFPSISLSSPVYNVLQRLLYSLHISWSSTFWKLRSTPNLELTSPVFQTYPLRIQWLFQGIFNKLYWDFIDKVLFYVP